MSLNKLSVNVLVNSRQVLVLTRGALTTNASFYFFQVNQGYILSREYKYRICYGALVIGVLDSIFNFKLDIIIRTIQSNLYKKIY
jgi:hypothetical protein